ncbi:MAG: T9SS type A sorting domain-containing protein [Bacteroidota bacterium]
MQKQAIIFLLSCISLMLFNVNASAQTRIIAQAEDGIDTKLFEPDQAMNVVLTTPQVRVANLNDAVKSAGQLPPGTEPLFLKFQLKHIEMLIPITSFSFEKYVNGYPVYISNKVEFIVNVEGICPPNTNNEKYTFNYTFTLATEDGENYPIHAPTYSQPSGIFSCRVFTLTCPNCRLTGILPFPTKTLTDPVFTGCPKRVGKSNYPTVSYPGALACGSQNKPNRNFPSYGNGQSNQWQMAVVSPNPFHSTLQLNYQLAVESQVNISIFNASGQMMYQNGALRDANQHELSIDTQSWAEGIYFCRIQTATDTQLLRVVKAN